MIATLSSRNM